MMVLEQLESPQGLDRGGVFGSIGKLAGGSGMLIDGDGSIGGVGCGGCRPRMVVSLGR